jgi:hypothetical protein
MRFARLTVGVALWTALATAQDTNDDWDVTLARGET